ncbi:MAG: hypothetical protein K8R88_02045 [Armatimonadetes bacterium]|nr:hypothetical protein [Armatimonadota bacterium]
MIILGLDCGGTSCKALACDESQAVLFEGQGGPGNWASTDRRHIKENLRQAIEGCPKPDIVFACLAGIMTDRDREECSDLLRAVLLLMFPGWSGQIKVEPDFVAVLGASPPDTQICAIAGTGSLVFGIQGDQIVKVGGGGPLIGDKGSAFWMGQQFLFSLIEEGDVSKQQKILEAHACTFQYLQDQLLEDTVPGIISGIYRQDRPATFIASLANMLATDATVIARIEFLHAAQLIASQINSLAGTLAITDSLKVSVSGGMWDIWPEMIMVLGKNLDSSELYSGEPVKISRPEVSPQMGAVRLGLKLI